MIFLHTSDLHIGKRLHETGLEEYQKAMLAEISEIARESDADGIIIAGDVYDRQFPPTEAVKLYDDFITELWKTAGKPIYMISGNHDSVDRLSQNSRILSEERLHISPNFIKHGIRKVTEEDRYGKINIFLFPYISPAMVRDRYGLERTPSWDASFEMLLSDMEEKGEIDWSERNIAVMHQFITGSERTDSENDVGGIDAVSGGIFSKFDYVALGHLHRPQTLKGGRMVYSGTPLKYSFSEWRDRKSVVKVELKEKGTEPVIERIMLSEPYSLIKEEGLFEELEEKGRHMNVPENEYRSITLLDDTEPVGALQTLRGIYGNVLEMKCTGTQRRLTATNEAVMSENGKARPPFDIVSEFYEEMNGEKLSEKGEEVLRDLILKAERELSEEARG